MELEEWQALVGRPEWRKFEQYLEDWRAQILDRIADGEFQVADRAERDTLTTDAIVRCQVMRDLVELQFETIGEFYYKPEDSYEEESKDGGHKDDDNS